MPEFTITKWIDAPIEKVWEVLDDFGEIQRWNPGVKYSELTSSGPVEQDSTRHCDFTPFGGVDERIDRYEPNKRLTVDLYKTYMLPISRAVADFNIAPREDGTELTLIYSYERNFMGNLIKGYTESQLKKGIGGLASSLKRESEKIAAAER